jgi:hypothetical protein
MSGDATGAAALPKQYTVFHLMDRCSLASLVSDMFGLLSISPGLHAACGGVACIGHPDGRP